ncbi:unnamed protein product, partial [Trichogramma brassicae]
MSGSSSSGDVDYIRDRRRGRRGRRHDAHEQQGITMLFRRCYCLNLTVPPPSCAGCGYAASQQKKKRCSSKKNPVPLLLLYAVYVLEQRNAISRRSFSLFSFFSTAVPPPPHTHIYIPDPSVNSNCYLNVCARTAVRIYSALPELSVSSPTFFPRCLSYIPRVHVRRSEAARGATRLTCARTDYSHINELEAKKRRRRPTRGNRCAAFKALTPLFIVHRTSQRASISCVLLPLAARIKKTKNRYLVIKKKKKEAKRKKNKLAFCYTFGFACVVSRGIVVDHRCVASLRNHQQPSGEPAAISSPPPCLLQASWTETEREREKCIRAPESMRPLQRRPQLLGIRAFASLLELLYGSVYNPSLNEVPPVGARLCRSLHRREPSRITPFCFVLLTADFALDYALSCYRWPCAASFFSCSAKSNPIQCVSNSSQRSAHNLAETTFEPLGLSSAKTRGEEGESERKRKAEKADGKRARLNEYDVDDDDDHDIARITACVQTSPTAAAAPPVAAAMAATLLIQGSEAREIDERETSIEIHAMPPSTYLF